MDFSIESFKELSKMIEDRLPFGRQIVNTILALAILAVVIFLIRYLFIAMAPTAAWLIVYIRTGNLPSLPSPTAASLISALLTSLAFLLLTFGVWGLSRDVAAHFDITKRYLDLFNDLNQQTKLLSDMIALIKKRLDAAQIPDDT